MKVVATRVQVSIELRSTSLKDPKCGMDDGNGNFEFLATCDRFYCNSQIVAKLTSVSITVQRIRAWFDHIFKKFLSSFSKLPIFRCIYEHGEKCNEKVDMKTAKLHHFQHTSSEHVFHIAASFD